MKKDMRIAALPVALVSIVVGIAGVASPDGGMALRRLYFATPGLFYAVVAVRSAFGLGLILAASRSRWPRILRALGAVVCLQGLSAMLLGLDHARAIMEWERMQGPALLRAGAAVALASGVFIVFAVTQRPSEEQRKATHDN
jgi:NADH:ubiquinone oxidoreductase subunit 6 (subunit J)